MMFDHRRILATAIARLRGKMKYRPVVFELMAPSFTLLELQRTVEALAGLRLHKQNFRRLVAEQGLVEGTGKFAGRRPGPPRRTVPLPPRSAARAPRPGRPAGVRRRPANLDQANPAAKLCHKRQHCLILRFSTLDPLMLVCSIKPQPAP